MANMSDYLEEALIDEIFRTSTSWSKPTVLAVCLLSTAAVDGDSGVFTSGTGVEITNANGYARKDHPPLDANWTAPSGGDGVTDNLLAITFDVATGDFAPGPVVASAITDSTTHNAGNLFFHGTVVTTQTILNTHTPQFPIGSLAITWA